MDKHCFLVDKTYLTVKMNLNKKKTWKHGLNIKFAQTQCGPKPFPKLPKCFIKNVLKMSRKEPTCAPFK